MTPHISNNNLKRQFYFDNIACYMINDSINTIRKRLEINKKRYHYYNLWFNYISDSKSNKEIIKKTSLFKE